MTISVNNLSIRAAENHNQWLVRDVTFDIPSGGITLLVGHSGAGKSTLMASLAGLVAPSSGTVMYDHRALWSGGRADKRVLLDIGVAFQQPEQQLFARTVRKEFEFSLKPYRLRRETMEARIADNASALALPEDLLEKFPLILSGGQKRRVALASTIATIPDWLFFDEPTAGLDADATGQLVAVLKGERKRRRDQQRGGIVIATHDLDTFFPLAERVIVLSGGSVTAVSTPSSLCEHPEVLRAANIGVPTAAVLYEALRRCGLDLPCVPLTPTLMAAQISAAVQERSRQAWPRNTERNEAGSAPGRVATRTDGAASLPTDAADGNVRDSRIGGFVRGLDVRAKWVSYFSLCVAVLFQHDVVGLVSSSAVVLALWRWGRVTMGQLKGVVPFVILMAVSVALSGLRIAPGQDAGSWHGLGFSTAAAGTTFAGMYKILEIIVLSVLLVSTTSTLAIQHGLEQALTPLRRVRVPVDALSLGASLTLRFIPVVMQEWRRLALVVNARGKSASKPGRVRLRDVPATVVPLLLAVFQFGELLATAMEARGYGSFGGTRTTTLSSAWQRNDFAAITVCILVSVLLLSVGAWT